MLLLCNEHSSLPEVNYITTVLDNWHLRCVTYLMAFVYVTTGVRTRYIAKDSHLHTTSL